MNKKFEGVGIAIVTPFKNDLSVDHESLTNIVNYNIGNGMDYIVISGTTGESVTITKTEKQEIIKTIKEANISRVPLVLGIGGNNTHQVIEEIKNTDFTGIDAILSVSPYYSKPTQEGIYQHYKAISAVAPVPIIMYNVPGRTSSNMLPQTTLRLAKDFENIIAVKEAGNNMSQYLWLLKDKPKDFMIISGDDDLASSVTLAGGSGVISVLGQAFPADFTKMIHLGLNGQAKEAFELHFKLMEITSLIFSENNPAGIKAVLEAMDLCDATVRLPLVQATNDLKNKIQEFLSNYSKS
ncbi:4-hydroxy-tetrahydrodipicolinate synthase [Hanstruepera neustonica]|uniref:4-hydroxy-tetrahydrodipicolinate synthase n=1 Tax=Hanstruepera neustonica TaxID=1445657 RepID=A0A2K1DXD0_9FLAO|nr:4-hydroxy-tetrahydrodipicolinate synthase [Hanstruepera neustonica]PNQ72687.1 4-hydroxy-tetrahydrodipicolinate synthase [Hanstruepera neustonica]